MRRQSLRAIGAEQRKFTEELESSQTGPASHALAGRCCSRTAKMELRGLEPLTCSLRRLRLRRNAVASESRRIGCIVVMIMMLRGTPGGTHGRIDNRALASGEVVARWMCTGCQHTCRQVATTREPRAQQPIPAAA